MSTYLFALYICFIIYTHTEMCICHDSPTASKRAQKVVTLHTCGCKHRGREQVGDSVDATGARILAIPFGFKCSNKGIYSKQRLALAPEVPKYWAPKGLNSRSLGALLGG